MFLLLNVFNIIYNRKWRKFLLLNIVKKISIQMNDRLYKLLTNLQRKKMEKSSSDKYVHFFDVKIPFFER